MDKKQKFLIQVDRDTGRLITLPDGVPVDKVPDGSHTLPFSGTQAQLNRLIKKISTKPHLLEKYLTL